MTLIEVLFKYSANSLDVSESVKDLDNKVQRIEDFSILPCSLDNFTQLFNDTFSSNPAAAGRFI